MDGTTSGKPLLVIRIDAGEEKKLHASQDLIFERRMSGGFALQRHIFSLFLVPRRQSEDAGVLSRLPSEACL